MEDLNVVHAVHSHFSHVQLFVTPWNIPCQAPLSFAFPRQEYWSGLPCHPLGILPTQRLNSCFLHLHIAGEFFTS